MLLTAEPSHQPAAIFLNIYLSLFLAPLLVPLLNGYIKKLLFFSVSWHLPGSRLCPDEAEYLLPSHWLPATQGGYMVLHTFQEKQLLILWVKRDPWSEPVVGTANRGFPWEVPVRCLDPQQSAHAAV